MAANRFDQLIDAWEPHLRQSFLEAFNEVRNAAQIDQIARMLERGDIGGALRAVGLDPIQFRVFDKAFESAYEAGGSATSTALPVVKDAQGFRVRFQFSIRNPIAENWLRQYSSNMIREIVDDQRNMIRGFLQDGLSKGLNPRTTALDLVGRIGANGQRQGGVIGLTESQEQWARNYAEELANNPASSLTRTLRDARFDRAVAKAVRDKEPIPADLRAKMVAAYRNRALRYRAETIARSETIRALHQAQHDAIDQAIKSGALKADTVTMVWRSAHDKRVRDAHRELNGSRIRYGGVFQSSLGPIRFPGDPNASVANTISCRCFLEPSVDFLSGIK
ncbi:phage minor head protein [Bradyrhizobium sp. URHD0069]|uniref:phage minor head protein n=1 Tax=Bradyrhizobium sp. URHD0069 TaxID=1380355 RepID=UPI000496EF0B|nr:phage minor head protein [Bradyrhizobium sp. URHD0069]